MVKIRGRTAPPPRKPETTEELAAVVQAFAVKQLDRGTGDAADWPKIAEACALAMFEALDKLPGDPRTLTVLRRLHAGAENRITQNPAYERDLLKPDTDKELRNTYGFDPAPPLSDGPGRR